MRLAFLLLVLANLALLAWQRGLAGPTGGREPQRLAQQIAPEKVRPLRHDQMAALRNTPAGAGARNGESACLEFGDFDEASLPRVEARLGELALGERLREGQVDAPNWFIVYLPPAASRAEAERTAQDLRARGVRDLVVMGPNTPMANAVLLGSFRDPEAAQRHQAELTRRGLRGVQLGTRGAGTRATRFEIRGIDAALAQRLAEIQKEFPQSRLGACGN